MTDITIRPLERSDKPGWLELWMAHLAFYEQDLAPEVTETLFERLHSDAGHRAFVAVQENELVGLVHYLFTIAPGPVRPPAIWKICMSAKSFVAAEPAAS